MKHRRERWKRAQPKKGKIWGGVVIGFMLLMIILASGSTAYAYGYYQSQLPLLQGLANQQTNQTTHIYDRNGLLLYDLYDTSTGGGRSTPVAYKYIPQILQDAMTSAEDPTFWTNSGIDPTGIVRAAIQYSQAGSVQSGGSTLTQQLIKNLTHDSQDTLGRKIPEAALAIGLTQQYPKWKILEMYFNIAPFGAQDLGVEAAVEDYFHLMPQCGQNHNCTPVYIISTVMPRTLGNATRPTAPLRNIAAPYLGWRVPRCWQVFRKVPSALIRRWGQQLRAMPFTDRIIRYSK